MDIQDCKVRVLNVDSQASFANIVVQVIGEMSTRSEPHHKFVQTFVLAEQPNGYFVLNDIFRYLNNDEDEIVEDEPVEEEIAQEKHTSQVEPVESAAEVNDTEAVTAEAAVEEEVNAKVEDIEKEEEAPSVDDTPEESTEVITEKPAE